jgi:2-oxoglutarate dehydrogenase E2 component (dihydrolipoamide succinyltransferase)
MIIDVKVPQLSESVAEATLVSWHKKEGEAVVARRKPDRHRDRQGRARTARAGRPACWSKIIKQDGETVVAEN